MTPVAHLDERGAPRRIGRDPGGRCIAGLGVESLRVIATCAVREAANGGDFCRRIKEELGIDVEVIDAELEAHLAFESVRRRFDLSGKNTVLADIGGGSTEIVLATGELIEAIYATQLGAVRLAEKFGGVPVNFDQIDPVREVMRATGGRGVDVAFEAAWADHSVQQAAEMVRLGGRVMLVGIPGSDRIEMKASTARRKGLTIRLSRRMKHTYPRALRLLLAGAVDLKALISHRFPLERTAEAFALNNAYADNVVKVIVEVA